MIPSSRTEDVYIHVEGVSPCSRYAKYLNYVLPSLLELPYHSGMFIGQAIRNMFVHDVIDVLSHTTGQMLGSTSMTKAHSYYCAKNKNSQVAMR